MSSGMNYLLIFYRENFTSPVSVVWPLAVCLLLVKYMLVHTLGNLT